MDMDEYKPNSFKYREDKQKMEDSKKIKPVVNGNVSVKKKSMTSKVKNSLQEDIPKVRNYILTDVVIPYMKKIISDSVRNGIDMILYGEVKKDNKPGSSISRVSYEKMYSSSANPYKERRIGNDVYDLDDIVFNTRQDAELVLTQMEDIIDNYHIVSVADLYDLVGVSCQNHCSNNYGWITLNSARVVRVRDGYILDLPRPKAI